MFFTPRDMALRIGNGIPTEDDMKAVTMRATGSPRDLELVRMIFRQGNELRRHDTKKLDAIFDVINRMVSSAA
jgi:hypothetical protein